MPTFTEDQIKSLAPDAASLKAGNELANARKWPALCVNERVLWGEVQGSGKDPYRTQVDLNSLAFNCSCPSRKFPCKHGLGLLYLYVRELMAFTNPGEPAWVTGWMDKRVEKAVTKPALEELSPETGVENGKTAVSVRTAAKRLDTVLAGAADLDRWLEDLIRTGLLTLPQKEAAYYQTMAARMVDAKAPGLARRVKQLAELPFHEGTAWQGDALRQLGQLHLLTQATRLLDQLPADMQEEVKSQLGIPISQKELLERPNAETLQDTFWVLGRQTSLDDDLTVQRNYLYGQRTGRFALILNFAYKNTPIETLLVPGTATDATLVFYPGRRAYRAVVTGQRATRPIADEPVALPDWKAAGQAVADVLTESPWADDVPQLVESLTLATNAGRYWLRDASGVAVPVDPRWSADAFYRWLALTGGRPTTAFVLRSERYVLPLGAWINETYQLI